MSESSKLLNDDERAICKAYEEIISVLDKYGVEMSIDRMPGGNSRISFTKGSTWIWENEIRVLEVRG